MTTSLTVQADDKIKEIIEIKQEVQQLFFKTAALMWDAKQCLISAGSKATEADAYIMERTGYGKTSIGRFLRARVAILNLEGQGVLLLPESEGMIRELACKVLNADAQTQADIWNKVLARADGESVTSAMVDMEVHFWKHGTYPLTDAEKLELKRIKLEAKEEELNDREAESARHEAENAINDADALKEELREELREELKAEMKAEMMAAPKKEKKADNKDDYIKILQADIAVLEADLSEAYAQGLLEGQKSSIDDDALTASILKAGFRQAAMQAHPDKGGSAEDMAALNTWKERAEAKGLI